MTIESDDVTMERVKNIEKSHVSGWGDKKDNKQMYNVKSIADIKKLYTCKSIQTIPHVLKLERRRRSRWRNNNYKKYV
jgi:hypothetical protein